MEPKRLGLPELAQIAAQKINELKLEGPLVLVGHSLGGILAAYIKEHNLCAPSQIDLVIAISSPFAGSATLVRALGLLPVVLSDQVRGNQLLEWFIPNSRNMDDLLSCMSGDMRRYRFIGADIDPFVRPDSAACRGTVCMRPSQTVIMPHLDHHNSVFSEWLVSQIVEWIDTVCTQEVAPCANPAVRSAPPSLLQMPVHLLKAVSMAESSNEHSSCTTSVELAELRKQAHWRKPIKQ